MISGIYLTLLGMGIVFLTLIFLTALTYVVEAIFKEKNESDIVAVIATAISEYEGEIEVYGIEQTVKIEFDEGIT